MVCTRCGTFFGVPRLCVWSRCRTLRRVSLTGRLALDSVERMVGASGTSDEAHVRLAEYLSRHGLKHTRQRDAILDSFLGVPGHVTSEDLYERVRVEHPEIGAATVYRTLKLFVDAGIANAHHFRDGVTLYESEGHHHDHLICVGCGDIVEFRNQVIEEELVGLAEKSGYRLTQHRLHLYGYCANCRERGES